MREISAQIFCCCQTNIVTSAQRINTDPTVNQPKLNKLLYNIFTWNTTDCCDSKSHIFNLKNNFTMPVQVTSLKRVIIFPFLTSQMNAPLRDVAPAMQFRSPLGHTQTQRSAFNIHIRSGWYTSLRYNLCNVGCSVPVVYMLYSCVHSSFLNGCRGFVHRCFSEHAICMLVIVYSRWRWSTGGPGQGVDHAFIARGCVDGC